MAHGMRTPAGLILTMALGSILWESAATAQDTVNSAATNEIVVTARRQSESLIDVPVAITVLTERDIQNADIESVAEFTRLVPNVTFDTGLNLGETHLTIRGISQVQGGQLPAAVVVDGVSLISPLQFNAENGDYAQIEVLKGPQGAIFGRNAIAGAINITTTRPGSRLQGEARIGIASGEDYRARLALNGPLVGDRLAFSASLAYSDRRGTLRNTTTNLYKDETKNLTGRLRFLAEPFDDLTFDIKYAYSDTEGGDPTYVPNTTGDVNDTGAPITADFIGRNPRTMHEFSAKGEWETGAGTVLLALAYVDIDEKISSDYDFTAAPLLLAFQDYRDRGFSQEVRFTSSRDDGLRWLVGAYHVRYTHLVETLALADPGLFLDPPAPTGEVSFPVAESLDRNRLENHSAFAQAEYDILPALELALALRYDHDRNRLRSGGTEREASFSKWQPKISLRYKLDEEMSLYASYGEGFRSGGFNPSGATIGDPIFFPESASTWEVGFRGNLLDRILAVNFAAFRTDLKNAQLLVLDVLSGSNVGLNVEETLLQGFEAELTARIAPSLTINGAFGYTDGEVEVFDDVPAFAGNRLPRVPRETVNLGFTHERAWSSELETMVRVDYQHIGNFYWDVANRARRDVVDYLNARFAVRHQPTGLSLALWGRNLLRDRTPADYQPITETGHPLGVDFFLPARGAEYGLDITFRF